MEHSERMVTALAPFLPTLPFYCLANPYPNPSAPFATALTVPCTALQIYLSALEYTPLYPCAELTHKITIKCTWQFFTFLPFYTRLRA